jgi:hypothetical protein
VGMPFPDRDLSQPGGVGADGGQLELAGGRADRGQRRGVGQAGHRVPPASSTPSTWQSKLTCRRGKVP